MATLEYFYSLADKIKSYFSFNYSAFLTIAKLLLSLNKFQLIFIGFTLKISKDISLPNGQGMVNIQSYFERQSKY